MLMYSGLACLKHSNFLKVNSLSQPLASECHVEVTEGCKSFLRTKHVRTSYSHRNPTTSFLTATTLIYAIGAGITAAAGTRLALQLLLTKGRKIRLIANPLQKYRSVISCHYLSESELGNLRACCHP